MAGTSRRRRASRFGPAMTKRATALRIVSKRLSTVVPATEPGPMSPEARGLRWFTATLGSRPALQHPGNTEVLVEFGPVDPHRHQLEPPARRYTGVPQPRIPFEWRRDPAAIRQRHHQLVGGEGNRNRPDIADINFQSAHAICLRGDRAVVAGGG